MKSDHFVCYHTVPRHSVYFCVPSVCCVSSSSSILATYNFGSMTFGIGLISVPSSCSMRCNANRSSYVIKLIAMPRCPKRPERPIRCKYVSAIFGKSKFITTFTAWTSIPLKLNSKRISLRQLCG